ncbi:MAG: hypothetical protein WC548_04630 [Candidatus Pacearchaeota archaeon]
MILLVNVCEEKLHYYEFVKPIEDILKRDGVEFFTKHYAEIHEEDLMNCSKVIICGTSLRDNGFMDNIDRFTWVKDFEKPLLGICAGMQIIGIVFDGKIKKHSEIGFFRENFKDNFLGLNNDAEVYHLHNYYVDFSKVKNFEIFSYGEIPQAVKHKHKKIYGVLFHPEVRQKELIKEFVNA